MTVCKPSFGKLLDEVGHRPLRRTDPRQANLATLAIAILPKANLA